MPVRSLYLFVIIKRNSLTASAMQAYHSSFNGEEQQLGAQSIASMALLPFHTKLRAPLMSPRTSPDCPPLSVSTTPSSADVLGCVVTAPADRDDIIAETLATFRANVLFRNFEIQGDSDRTLIYLTLFVSDCLARIGQGEPHTHGRRGVCCRARERRGEALLSRFDPRHVLHTGERVAADKETAAKWTTPQEAAKHLQTHAHTHFTLPGEPGFPLNSLYGSCRPGTREADELRAYLTALRAETTLRLSEHVLGDDAQRKKWWLAFQKRKFIGKSLGS